MKGEAPARDVVTGAFGYTGKYITRRLLAMGRKVRTLTGHPNRPNPFGDQVEIASLDFKYPERLVQALRGHAVLYNTYWLRFNHGRATFDEAVANTKIFIRAAREAGIHKIVHVSIANPSVDSPLPYYSGKSLLEKAVIDSDLPYAILRPTVIFGPEDILINNIAWFLRHAPVFVVPGSGRYRIQPVFVKDVAELAVAAAFEDRNTIFDAVGPEVYAFDKLVQLIRSRVGSKSKIIHANPTLTHLLTSIAGLALRDVVLTRDELEGLMADLLVSKDSPTGHTRFSEWLGVSAPSLGIKYASELARHYA